MGSSGKKRTTFAKLNREAKLRDRREDKKARKAARRLAVADEPGQDAVVGLETADDRGDDGPATDGD